MARRKSKAKQEEALFQGMPVCRTRSSSILQSNWSMGGHKQQFYRAGISTREIKRGQAYCSG